MDHVAIMRKSWGLLPKILTGEKKIESRWYSIRCRPWGAVNIGDTIYFKNSGEPVAVKAKVGDVKQFANLNPDQAKQILSKYGRADGLAEQTIPEYFERFKNKKYCLLVFLLEPEAVKPFEINKSGFGSMSAWITVKNISAIKK